MACNAGYAAHVGTWEEDEVEGKSMALPLHSRAFEGGECFVSGFRLATASCAELVMKYHDARLLFLL